jgi:hypothetical protein
MNTRDILALNHAIETLKPKQLVGLQQRSHHPTTE